MVFGMLGLVLVSLCPTASAAPGDHLHLGDVIVTPRLDLSLGYDSNVWLADGVLSPAVGAPGLIVEPSFALSLARTSVQLDWSVGYQLRKLLDLRPNDGSEVRRLDRYNEVESTLGLELFPDKRVGLLFDDVFSIENQPTEVTGAENANVVTTSNDATGGVALRPHTALAVDLLGQVGLDNYRVPDSESATTPTYNNRASFGPQAHFTWSILPKSSLLLDGAVTWYRWQNHLVEAVGPEAEGPDYGVWLGKPDSLAWRALLGTRWQLSTKIGLKAEAGYGLAWYDEQTVLDAGASIGAAADELDLGEGFGQDVAGADGLLFDVKAFWTPVKSQSVTLGYRRDFEDAVFTNYIAYDYVFLRYGGLFVDRLGAAAELGLRLQDLHGEVDRSDVNLLAKGEISYALTRFAGVRLAGQWSERMCAAKGCEGVYSTTEYRDFQGEAGLTLTY